MSAINVFCVCVLKCMWNSAIFNIYKERLVAFGQTVWLAAKRFWIWFLATTILGHHKVGDPSVLELLAIGHLFNRQSLVHLLILLSWPYKALQVCDTARHNPSEQSSLTQMWSDFIRSRRRPPDIIWFNPAHSSLIDKTQAALTQCNQKPPPPHPPK